MYLNGYSLRIPEGKEDNGYVLMRHGKNYSLQLRNSNSVRCDVRVEIDGQYVGTWRLEAGQSAKLKRPAHDSGRFTFYKAGSSDGDKIGLRRDDPNLGLVKAVFTPEAERVNVPYVMTTTDGPPWRYAPGRPVPLGQWDTWDTSDTSAGSVPEQSEVYCSAPADDGKAMRSSVCSASANMAPSGVSAGGTGLAGESGQQFGVAGGICYDWSKQSTIHLRLVCGESDEPRPLTQFSTPVPPSVGD